MSSLRAAFSLGFFVGSLLVGWWLSRRGVLTPSRTSRLTQVLVKYPAPFVLCLSLWRVELDTWRLGLLPLIGAAVAGSTLLPAWGYARWARLSPPRMGSVLVGALFSNLGYIGAFTAFALFGEEAYGLCMLYLTFFSPLFYTAGFAIARRCGHRSHATATPGALTDDLRLYPFLGMVVGIALNLLEVPRPLALTALNHVLIPVDTALYLIAVGSQLIFRPFARSLRPGIAMSLIKFLYTPTVAWLIVSLVGLEGLPRFVVLLAASTPVAVSTLILPLLFGLDRELSNALWLVTTLLSIPWLLLVIPALQHL